MSEETIGGELRWERVALTNEQVAVTACQSSSDRRYKDGRPHRAVETEALRQTVLVEDPGQASQRIAARATRARS
jgi:hypothetical protein